MDYITLQVDTLLRLRDNLRQAEPDMLPVHMSAHAAWERCMLTVASMVGKCGKASAPGTEQTETTVTVTPTAGYKFHMPSDGFEYGTPSLATRDDLAAAIERHERECHPGSPGLEGSLSQVIEKHEKLCHATTVATADGRISPGTMAAAIVDSVLQPRRCDSCRRYGHPDPGFACNPMQTRAICALYWPKGTP